MVLTSPFRAVSEVSVSADRRESISTLSLCQAHYFLNELASRALYNAKVVKFPARANLFSINRVAVRVALLLDLRSCSSILFSL